MKREELSKCRGTIIEKFINIEWLINAIITQYFFKKVYSDFLFKFLYDEYCNFGLKRRVLEKIIPNLDKVQLNNLNRLNTIRNYFSHCNQEITKVDEKRNEESVGIVPDPRNIETGINFQALYDEFLEKEEKLTPYLARLFEDLGGVMEE